ncbi:MAG TPA: gas vesicle protein GvpJ [Conexibacter sp.]|nr:gas vesicle protein GvpJ [Conexibacter sp.]
MSVQPSPGGALERSQESSLADVVNTILDKGVVVDVFARVSLVGIELLRADVRIVIASVDTYLRFAEEVGRLQLGAEEPRDLTQVVEGISEGGAKGKTRGALEAGAEKLGDLVGGGDDDKKEKKPARHNRERRRR